MRGFGRPFSHLLNYYRTTRAAFAALSLSTGLACRSAAPVESGSSAQRALVACVSETREPPRDSVLVRSTEDAFVALSRSVEGGFTAISGEGYGPLTIAMVDTSRAAGVRRALASLLASAAGDSAATIPARLATATLRPVPWSLAQLTDWNSYLAAILLPAAFRSRVALVGVGIDTFQARVVVFYEDDRARAWIESTLSAARIPCGLVELRRSAATQTA